MTRRAYEDRILRAAQRIQERREAEMFAQAFVRLPPEEQDAIREEFNRPFIILGLLADQLGHDLDTSREDSA